MAIAKPSPPSTSYSTRQFPYGTSFPLEHMHPQSMPHHLASAEPDRFAMITASTSSFIVSSPPCLLPREMPCLQAKASIQLAPVPSACSCPMVCLDKLSVVFIRPELAVWIPISQPVPRTAPLAGRQVPAASTRLLDVWIPSHPHRLERARRGGASQDRAIVWVGRAYFIPAQDIVTIRENNA